MDDICDDFLRVARRCERTAKSFEIEPAASIQGSLRDAIDSVGEAWSGSWIGYQASVYTQGLRPRKANEHFDSEWGDMDAISNRTMGDWNIYDYDTVYQEILERSGNVDTEVITHAAKQAERAFAECKADLLPAFDALLSKDNDKVLQELREKLSELKSHHAASVFLQTIMPKQMFSRDRRALQGGCQPPHHLAVQAWLLEEASHGKQAAKLAEIARHAATYLQKAKKMKGNTVTRIDGPVFVGHGQSPLWKDVKDFLADRLGLEYEEFNREPTAGISTKERLLEMLDRCCFAFLVMTAEDECPDGRFHARQNVVHEAGLFQGRYGFERAIILLENECQDFSNIHGIGQIRFPKGNIMAASEEIRRVLEREGILPSR